MAPHTSWKGVVTPDKGQSFDATALRQILSRKTNPDGERRGIETLLGYVAGVTLPWQPETDVFKYEVLTMTQAPTTIKKDTNFDIGRQYCECCQKWMFFYRLKLSNDSWFCQMCNTNVNSVESAYNEGGTYAIGS